MKLIVFSILICLFSISGILFFKPDYKSAFEADQSCHEILRAYSQDVKYGCDHDLETRQWLLFQDDLENEPAKVIQRFRY